MSVRSTDARNIREIKPRSAGQRETDANNDASVLRKVLRQFSVSMRSIASDAVPIEE